MVASSSFPIYEGVLAINKPTDITSAQVIRDAQNHFDPSDLFKPWIDREKNHVAAESRNQQAKRRWRGKRKISVKMGHGGTLDPMATGVLILGLGSGTKQLQHFMTECVKTYDAVVLFGAATDSYDRVGKIVARAPYEHVTRDGVEAALEKFKGKIMQRPPIFSALHVQGKRLYEYARAGEKVPVEIAERPVETLEMNLTEWYPGGTHKWQWPTQEAEQDMKAVAEQLLQPGAEAVPNDPPESSSETQPMSKRKRNDDATAVSGGQTTNSPAKRIKPEDEALTSKTKVSTDEISTLSNTENARTEQQEAAVVTDTSAAKLEESPENPDATSAKQQAPCPAPACRIVMTVTSGFYVRSLCHDLGAAVGSLALMSDLVRTQQGDFALGKNVLEYEDLKRGEEVWGPQVQKMLSDWEPMIKAQPDKPQKTKWQHNKRPWKSNGGSAAKQAESKD